MNPFARLRRDVRDATRSLRRDPQFALSAIGILALGIGVSTSMFGLADTVLRRPLPVRDQDRVVVFRARGLGNLDHVPVSYARYVALRERSRAVTELAGFDYGGTWPQVYDDGDRHLTLTGGFVTGNLFRMLGTHAVIGRLLEPSDDVVGAAPVMVVSEAAWRREFLGDSSIVGRRLVPHGRRESYTIVGVVPSGLAFPSGAEYWAPIVPHTTPDPSSPGKSYVDLVGRLAPGAIAEQARAEFQEHLRREGFGDRVQPVPGATASVELLSRKVFGSAKPALIAMATAVALLFLITCINVGNLLLLRAAGRRRELAVRRAVGARYADVARQLIVENTLIAATAGILGLAFAAAFSRVIPRFAPSTLPRLDDVTRGGVPLAIAIGVTCLATILFGVVPALIAAREDPASALQAGSRSGTESPTQAAFKHVLVACQVALAVVVLAAAGVVMRSLARLEGLDLGFDPENLIVLESTWPAGGLADVRTTQAAMDEVLERVSRLPGVVAATPVLATPFSGPGGWDAQYNARSSRGDTTMATWLNVEAVGPRYFETFHIPLRRGRSFTGTDRAGVERVVIVSESVARHFWPGVDPIGQEIGGPFIGKNGDYARVVGVAPDTRYRDLRAGKPTIYFPHRQFITAQPFIVARTAGDPYAIVPAARKAIAEVGSDLLVWRAHSMNDLLDVPLAQPRLSAALLTAFGGGALLLAALGLYAVTSTVVRSRTRELGIRLALGASPLELHAMVIRQAAKVMTIGIVIGLIGAVAATRFVRALLFEVSPIDPLSLAAVTFLLVLVALIAALVPARRAARVDPVGALRAD